MHCVPVIFQFLSICKKGSSAPESAVAGIVLILFILVLMLALLYCFNHEERLTLFFQRHVVQRCLERRKSKFKVQDKLKRLVSWLTMVEKYREEAMPKKQTITIRFENLSLVLKKVKFRWEATGKFWSLGPRKLGSLGPRKLRSLGPRRLGS
jgi:hypothetical protein